jgi:putative restriction endonuclease
VNISESKFTFYFNEYINACKNSNWIDGEIDKFFFAKWVASKIDFESQTDEEVLEIILASQKQKFRPGANEKGIYFIKANYFQPFSLGDVSFLRQLVNRSANAQEPAVKHNKTMPQLSIWLSCLNPQEFKPWAFFDFRYTLEEIFTIDEKAPKKGYKGFQLIQSLFKEIEIKLFEESSTLSPIWEEALSQSDLTKLDWAWITEDFINYIYRELEKDKLVKNYWWVNKNKSKKDGINDEGFMWSPKTKKNGDKNPYYDNMELVKPGDVVFTYINQKIRYLGIVKSESYTKKNPHGKKDKKNKWAKEGWMVNVDYRELINKISPKDHIDQIRPLLPTKYSPLKSNGDGQELFLTGISSDLADVILEIIGESVNPILSESSSLLGSEKSDKEAEEDLVEKEIQNDPALTKTEVRALTKARIGQGKFRNQLIKFWNSKCSVSGVDLTSVLIASHIKSWKDSDNREKLDPNNGLLLSPNYDKLFDKYLISFDSEGRIIISSDLNKHQLELLGINEDSKLRKINDEIVHYLKIHNKKMKNV